MVEGTSTRGSNPVDQSNAPKGNTPRRPLLAVPNFLLPVCGRTHTRASEQGPQTANSENAESTFKILKWLKQLMVSNIPWRNRSSAPVEVEEIFECLICTENRRESERGAVPKELYVSRSTLRQSAASQMSIPSVVDRRRQRSSTRSTDQQFRRSSSRSVGQQKRRPDSQPIGERTRRSRSRLLSGLKIPSSRSLAVRRSSSRLVSSGSLSHFQVIDLTGSTNESSPSSHSRESFSSTPASALDTQESEPKADYCMHCIEQDVLAQRGDWPVKYIDRQADWSLDEVQDILRDNKYSAERKLFETRSLEYALQQSLDHNSETLVHCPTPDCHGLVVCDRAKVETKMNTFHVLWERFRRVPDSRRFHCYLCDKVSCISCGSEWMVLDHSHNYQTCSRHARRIKKAQSPRNVEVLYQQWVITHDTQNCPGCSVLIERNRGCQHMTCRNCSHQFCWYCKRPWSQCQASCVPIDRLSVHARAAMVKVRLFFTSLVP